MTGTGAGNSCAVCKSGCSCAGGTAAPVCKKTCAAGQYLNASNTCVNCDSGYYCPGGTFTPNGTTQGRNICPPTTTDKVYHYNGSAVRSSPVGASAATQCYLDSSKYDYWTFEFQYHGFYRATGKCYYSDATKIYNNCENNKRFGECNAGYYINNSTPMGPGFTNSCTACSPGTYTTAYGNIGDYGNDGSYHYSTSCSKCAKGTYVDKSAATGCKTCPSGYDDNPNTGQSSQSGCQIYIAAGKYLPTKNGTTAVSCAPGAYKGAHYVNYGNTSSCEPCPAGTYSSSEGAGACTACSGANQYQPKTGQTSCLTVPFGYTKVSNSSVAPITLDCPAGQFMWHWGDKTVCETCHAGYYCPGGKNIFGSGGVGTPNSAGIVPIYSCPSEYKDGGQGLSTQGQCTKSCDKKSVSNGYIPPVKSQAKYPNVCEYNTDDTVCNGGYGLTDGKTCAQLCTAGITKLRLGGGLTIPLYKTRQTTPALNVKYSSQICYGSLASGLADGALNVKYGGKTYHGIK